MAEAVGLVASIVGIAGLAGKIITTIHKVNSLLKDIRNVPEELQRYLDQIQLFTPLVSSIDDDGPAALKGALTTAVHQCQQAADELGKLAEDLHNQIHTGGRARRKVGALRVILQKDAWAAHEKRLASAVQMLMMASQMYGLAQQKYLM